MRVKFHLALCIFLITLSFSCYGALPAISIPSPTPPNPQQAAQSDYEKKVREQGLIGHQVGPDGKNVVESGKKQDEAQDKDNVKVDGDGKSLREKNLAWVDELNKMDGVHHLDPKLMDLDGRDYKAQWESNKQIIESNGWMKVADMDPYVDYSKLNLKAGLAFMGDLSNQDQNNRREHLGCDQGVAFGIEAFSNGTCNPNDYIMTGDNPGEHDWFSANTYERTGMYKCVSQSGASPDHPMDFEVRVANAGGGNDEGHHEMYFQGYWFANDMQSNSQGDALGAGNDAKNGIWSDSKTFYMTRETPVVTPDQYVQYWKDKGYNVSRSINSHDGGDWLKYYQNPVRRYQ